MYPVSQAFLGAALAGNQRASVRAEAWLSGVRLGTLPALDGTVTVDATRSVLRSVNFTCTGDETTTADTVWGWLSTLGVELRVWRGLYVAGALEEVPLGVFVVTDVERAKDVITVNGSDRSIRIQRARWTDPYAIAAGTTLAAALNGLLADRWPAVTSVIAVPDTVVLGSKVTLDAGADSDPWSDAREIAESFGYDLHFDATGNAAVRSIPDPMSSPVVAAYAYGEQSVVIDDTKRTTFERTYSGVIVSGEGSDVEVPVRAEAWDEDPQSPTYFEGPFGKVPYFVTSNLITTEAQAAAVAIARLPLVKGRVESISWTQIVNPAHDALDVVEVEWEDGTTSRVILDVVTVPLSTGGTMGAQAREMRRY